TCQWYWYHNLIMLLERFAKRNITHSVTVLEVLIRESDLGRWNITDTNTIDYWICSGPSLSPNHDSNVSNPYTECLEEVQEEKRRQGMCSNVS
ncbi:hypothetical protein SK128_003578, partial [Halocaridina rubra]